MWKFLPPSRGKPANLCRRNLFTTEGGFYHIMRKCSSLFGGAPQAIVTDNLKSAVTRSSKYEPTLNEASVTLFCTTTWLPAAGPYKPKHKALVEG